MSCKNKYLKYSQKNMQIQKGGGKFALAQRVIIDRKRIAKIIMVCALLDGRYIYAVEYVHPLPRTTENSVLEDRIINCPLSITRDDYKILQPGQFVWVHKKPIGSLRAAGSRPEKEYASIGGIRSAESANNEEKYDIFYPSREMGPRQHEELVPRNRLEIYTED